jgi:hypothetical protein
MAAESGNAGNSQGTGQRFRQRRSSCPHPPPLLVVVVPVVAVAMRSSLPLTLLRQSANRQALRQRAPRSVRFASTNTEAAQKKAQETLATAQASAEKFLASAKKFLGPVGDKAGQLLGCTYPSGVSWIYWLIQADAFIQPIRSLCSITSQWRKRL